jgi:predicted metalloprotease
LSCLERSTVAAVIALVLGGIALYADRPDTGPSQIEQQCQTGMSANRLLDCEIVAVANSLDGYWSDAFTRSGQSFMKPRIGVFAGSADTGCGQARSDTGPFYCPADSKIYIDPNFFHELESRFRAQGGPGARGYVIAHVYGHHVRKLAKAGTRSASSLSIASGRRTGITR